MFVYRQTLIHSCHWNQNKQKGPPVYSEHLAIQLLGANVRVLPPSKHLLVLKTSSKRLQDMSSTRLQRNNFTSSMTYWRSLEDVWPRRIYWSWPRRLEDMFWRRKAKANIFVFIKTSWRRLEDVFWRRRRRTSSRRLHQDDCLLGYVTLWIKIYFWIFTILVKLCEKF